MVFTSYLLRFCYPCKSVFSCSESCDSLCDDSVQYTFGTVVSNKGFCNNTNTKISDCQALKQQFCWWMDRRHFAKSDQDPTIAQTRGDGKEMFKAAKKVITPANKVLSCLTMLVKFL